MSQELQTGIAYALLAGVLWGLSPLLLKRAIKYTNVSNATLVEQYVAVLLLVGLAAHSGEIVAADLTSRAFWAFFLAGAVGASFGKVFYYRGIDKVGASKATSVKNSSPLLTAILAIAFLGEDVNGFIVAGILAIILGIAVLTQTRESSGRPVDRLRYFLFPLIAALCFGINPIFKKIGMNAANLPVLGALITQTTALVFMIFLGKFIGLKPKWERIPAPGLILLALSGATEACGSLFTFFALGYGPAALLSPIWRISPLVTFALARFTLKGVEVVTLRDGIAAALIVFGVFILSRG
jgi:uncharacterized membrane protein